MIVLKLPLFITVAFLLLIIKETTSAAELNKHIFHIVGDKPKLHLHEVVSVSPWHTRHWRGLRGLVDLAEDACTAQRTAVESCAWNVTTGSACVYCMNDENRKAWTAWFSSSNCQAWEDDMCNALKVNCGLSCYPCFNEFEAFNGCALVAGSLGKCTEPFECGPSPDMIPLPISCDAERIAAESCINNNIATVSECATCINDEYDKVHGGIIRPTCESFEDAMCNALKVVCSPSCNTACFNKIEAFFACKSVEISDGLCAKVNFKCFPCDAENSAAESCVENTATGSECATCIRDEYDKVLGGINRLTCSSFEDDMCNALKVVCSPSCDACVNELEAVFGCAIEAGSAGECTKENFDCAI